MLFGSGLDPLMSPVTPMTPYPATTPGGTFSASAQSGFNWTLPPGLRSRTNSVALPTAQAKPAEVEDDAELQLRIPGAVNYKNVWYAPGSTIQSGGLASQRGAAKSATKRLRKWKV